MEEGQVPQQPRGGDARRVETGEGRELPVDPARPPIAEEPQGLVAGARPGLELPDRQGVGAEEPVPCRQARHQIPDHLGLAPGALGQIGLGQLGDPPLGALPQAEPVPVRGARRVGGQGLAQAPGIGGQVQGAGLRERMAGIAPALAGVHEEDGDALQPLQHRPRDRGPAEAQHPVGSQGLGGQGIAGDALVAGDPGRRGSGDRGRSEAYLGEGVREHRDTQGGGTAPQGGWKPGPRRGRPAIDQASAPQSPLERAREGQRAHSDR